MFVGSCLFAARVYAVNADPGDISKCDLNTYTVADQSACCSTACATANPGGTAADIAACQGNCMAGKPVG